MKNYHIMFIAGEASGDMRAAGLARALKELDPTLRLSGIGGSHMRQAGVECFTDITQLAVIGIAEVVKNLSRIKKVFDQTLKQIDATHPDCVILIDYPGFNLRLAQEIKKRKIWSSCPTLTDVRHSRESGNPLKIIYYISPQVWAWREKRVLQIKKLVDRMIVLFPFEQGIYSKYGMKVDCVGHPLVDEIIVDKNQTEVLKSIGLSAGKTTIGLMPGSRAKEVERHLAPMLEAAQMLFKQNKERQFILLKASSVPLKLIESILSSHGINPFLSFPASSAGRPNANPPLSFPHALSGNPKYIPIKIYEGLPYDGKRPNGELLRVSGMTTELLRVSGMTTEQLRVSGMRTFDFDGINAADAVIVASGTATLETALLKKPMVIIYKTSWLTYAVARALIKIPYIGLVNIVAGKKIVEELIQNKANAANIANALEAALHNPHIVDELAAVKDSLGGPGASLRAARIILEELHVNS